MADIASILGENPLRLTLTREDDPLLVLAVQFNPSTMKEKGGADWNGVTVPGLSHEVLQFKNTQNPVHTFTLVWLASEIPDVDGWKQLIAARLFFRTACRPRRDASTLQSAGAPRLLLFCPNFMSCVCVLTSYTIVRERHAASGLPTHLVVDVELKEIRDTPIYADEFFEERV